jgi:hypothetical protein
MVKKMVHPVRGIRETSGGVGIVDLGRNNKYYKRIILY